jgi:hypothetical protein
VVRKLVIQNGILMQPRTKEGRPSNPDCRNAADCQKQEKKKGWAGSLGKWTKTKISTTSKTHSGIVGFPETGK